MALVRSDLQHRQRLEAWLAQANGRRRARVLTLEQVLATAEEAARDASGQALRDGGTVADAREHTTLCLAVREGQAVTVGVGEARANEPNPGQIWKDLAPWASFDDARNQLRCRVWARRRPDRTVVLPLEHQVPASAAVGNGEALLQAVLDRPDDDAVRHVYGDWLLERGDERGELIALQLGLERVAPHSAEWHRLREAAAGLLARLEQRWLQRLPAGASLVVRRGFVEQVTLTADAVVRGDLDALLALEPLTSLRVLDTGSQVLSRLAGWHGLSRLRTLSLLNLRRSATWALRAEQLAALLESDRLRGLLALQLGGHELGDAGALVLARAVPAAAPHLERLDWRHDELSMLGAEVLFSMRWFSKLRRLGLADLRLDGTLAALCAQAPTTQRLESLDLSFNNLGDEGALALAASARLGNLRALSLKAAHLGAVGAQVLLDSPALRGLHTLDLTSNRIGKKMAARLRERFGPASSGAPDPGDADA